VITATDLKGCITKVGSALRLKAPQKTPFILPDTCRLEGQSTWDGFKKRRQELEDQEAMVALGRHPRLIYEIWIKRSSLRPDFWARSYRFRQDKKLEQNPNKTETTITTKSISAARNYPRTAQVDVMGGKSANDVSNTFWGSQYRLTPTQLFHRSRRMFGATLNKLVPVRSISVPLVVKLR
jgi:hypothetical protein